jgi:hypothetical protein
MEEVMKALFDPEKIERDLRILEREYSLTETRTVLFNLVIFANREELAPIEENLLIPLLGKRAARIIRISLGHSGETSVSVPHGVRRTVKIWVCASRRSSSRTVRTMRGVAPGSWSAFLIRDLPVYVLWHTPLPEGDSIGPLSFAREQADKFLLDGEYFLQKDLPLKDYIQRVRKQLIDAGVQVSDFTWERIRPLRIFTAQVFDQKALMDLLPYVTSLEVSGPSPLSRFYYSTWVRCVLEEEGRKLEVVSRQADTVQVVFRFRDTSDPLVWKVDPEGMGRAFFGTEEVLARPLKFPSDGAIPAGTGGHSHCRSPIPAGAGGAVGAFTLKAPNTALGRP